jgi:hypothetical protein
MLAAGPVRDFFDLKILNAGQWFLAMLSAAAGLLLASAAWRLPVIQRLESPEPQAEEPESPEPQVHMPPATHTPPA